MLNRSYSSHSTTTNGEPKRMKRFLALCTLALALTLASTAQAKICPVTQCGDTNDDGKTVASDALATLRIAVGLPVRADDCTFTVATGRRERKTTLQVWYDANEGMCFVPVRNSK